jgi:hypothetical protein
LVWSWFAGPSRSSTSVTASDRPGIPRTELGARIADHAALAAASAARAPACRISSSARGRVSRRTTLFAATWTFTHLPQCVVMRTRGSRRWRGELIGGCAANRRLSALRRRSVFPFRAERRAEANSAEPGPPVGVGLRGTSDLGAAEARRAVRVRLAGRHPAADRCLSTAWRNVSASACAEIRSAG